MTFRIAWLGPTPVGGGGVAYMATTLLRTLPAAGVEVDCFLGGEVSNLPPELEAVDGLRFVTVASGWEYERWYSRTDLSKVMSGHLARARTQDKLVSLIAERHAREPYDALYQFSQFELLSIRRFRKRLPPVVVHPETHAAGELLWHRRERALAERCEPTSRHFASRAMLTGRARIQRADARVVDHLICPSRAFATEVVRDYGLQQEDCSVVANPIDLSRFTPPDEPRATNQPLRIVYLSRLAVRKGAEMVVALSHRLADLEGRVELKVVGDKSLWSDYRCLMDDLRPGLASYDGGVWARDAPALLRGADIVIQPSHYEPFALTVGEALASGLPVVVSDVVGAGEGIDERCCRRFAAGDLDAFEAAVRRLVHDLEGGARDELAALSRSEAERAFAPERIAAELASVLKRVAA